MPDQNNEYEQKINYLIKSITQEGWIQFCLYR